MHVDDETRLKHIREAALEALEMVRDATREDLVLCNTHSDGHSLVAAGHLRRQRYSPCQKAGLRSLPCI